MRLSEKNILGICLIGLTVIVMCFGARLFDWASGMPRGNELLLAAAAGGRVEDIDQALSQGASIDARSEGNLTALMLACNNGHPVIVRRLLEHGADPNAKAGYGVSPMFNAILADDAEIVGVLIEAGAITNELRYGETLLDIANRLQAHRAAHVLRQSGAKSASAMAD